jgi:hypothetical protein
MCVCMCYAEGNREGTLAQRIAPHTLGKPLTTYSPLKTGVSLYITYAWRIITLVRLLNVSMRHHYVSKACIINE